MSCIEFRNFVTFSDKYDVEFQIFCLYIISGKNVLPPKLNKLLRLYGPAYLHAEAFIPQQPWRSPHSNDSPLSRHASPHPTHPTPTNNFWTFYTQFCAILCAFSVNFGSWQSGIMTPQKLKNGVGKTYCICKLRIKRNRASVASEKNFLEKMIGRLYI